MSQEKKRERPQGGGVEKLIVMMTSASLPDEGDKFYWAADWDALDEDEYEMIAQSTYSEREEDGTTQPETDQRFTEISSDDLADFMMTHHSVMIEAYYN